MKAPLLIVNPTSGGGRAGRRLADLTASARRRWPGLTLRTTTAPGDAERFAREWCEDPGAGPIVVAGGDGTVHEVLNGMAPGAFRVQLGILPAGTGNDFAAGAGLALDLAAPGDAGSRTRMVDVGRLRFTTPAGEAVTRVFANAASVGVVPRANRIAHRIRRGLPGRLCYRLGGVAALLSTGPREYLVRAGDATIHAGPALSLTFANGAAFGGGMRISPGSRLDDGALDLVAIGALGVPRALLALARVERGGHVGLRGVSITRLGGPAIVVGPSGPWLVEADGEELIASGPVTVDILPGAITLFA